MTKYYIYEPRQTLDEAIEYDYSIETDGDEEEALYDWLKSEERNGNYSNGYPDREEYIVYNSEILTQKTFEV